MQTDAKPANEAATVPAADEAYVAASGSGATADADNKVNKF